MASYTSTARSFSGFSDLAVEIILLLCDSCDDNDLLALSLTSRHLHCLALTTLLSRHGISQSDILSGVIAISTRSLLFFQRALFVSSVNRLTCVLEGSMAERGILGLRRMVSRLPQIGEVEVAVNRPIVGTMKSYHTEQMRREAFLELLSALITDKSATLLILGGTRFSISRPRRVVSSGSTGPRINDIHTFTFGADNFLREIITRAHMPSVVLDTGEHTFQDQRICDDVRPILPKYSPLYFRFSMLPFPTLEKWAMVTFYESHMSKFVIEAMLGLDGYWGVILSSLHFPYLATLTISDDVHLSFSDFTAFVQRHSAIRHLTLGYNSILPPSPPSSPLAFLRELTTLIGQPPQVAHVLRSAEIFPRLKFVVVDPPLSHIRQLPLGQDPDDHMETVQTHFSFTKLNVALEAIAQLSGINDLELSLTLPGQSESKQWLDIQHEERAQRAEYRLHAVSTLKVCTACEKPFSIDTLPLLAHWLSLFPSLRRLEFCLRTLPPMDAWHSSEFKDSIRRVCPHMGHILTTKRSYHRL